MLLLVGTQPVKCTDLSKLIGRLRHLDDLQLAAGQGI